MDLRIKVLIPGYRFRFRRHFSLMLEHLRELAPHIHFGSSGEIPWMQIDGIEHRFHGFCSGKKELLEHFVLDRAFPKEISKEHYRIVKDYINRYMYPHMILDAIPQTINAGNWAGFHGQHKEHMSDYGQIDQDYVLSKFHIKPDDIIINGGAFIGFGDMHVSKLIPNGRIIAVEASSSCYSVLNKNIEHNGIQNVTTYFRALWNKETKINLEVGPAQANTLIAEVRAGESKQSVNTITIDNIVIKEALSKVDMISLTLNGAEVEALEGADQTISEFRPRIRLAGWYIRDGLSIWQHAKRKLEAKNYRVITTPRGNVIAFSN